MTAVTSTPLRLLLVDDNPDDRALVLRELRREFPDLHVAEITEQDGFNRALENGDFSLVITDYQLRWSDGLTVLRALKSKWPHCPVVMFTGTGSEEIAVEAIKSGLDDYVLKSPQHYGRLATRVHSTLEQALSKEKLLRAENALRKSDTMLHAIIEAEPECVKILGADGKLRYMNAAGLALVEADSPAQALGKCMTDLVMPQYRLAFDALRQRVLQGESCILEFDITGLKGGHRWLETHAVPLELEDGPGLLGITRDITARKLAEASRAELAAVIEATSDFVGIADAEGRVVYLNHGGRKMMGIAPDEDISATRMADYHSREVMETIRAEAIPTALREGSWSGETCLLSRSGEEIPVSQVIIAHPRHEGGTQFYSTIVRDLTERKRHEAELIHLANHNALTGLPNRTLLCDRLQQALIEAKRHDRLIALMFLDLNRFKHITESLGHEVGDLVLKEFAEQLAGLVREGDTVAHLGSDEFALLFNDVAHSEDAARLAQKVLDHFNHSTLMVGGHSLFVTASAGIALYPADSASVDGLLRAAATAMDRAQSLGGNTYQFYSSEMNAKALENLALSSALHYALKRNELELHYQPLVNFVSGEIVGMEALLRWHHPLLGMVSPAVFIPLAEETGLIASIGTWVLREACRQNKAWQDEGLAPLRVAVNLSARQFVQRDIAATITRILAETGLESRFLELEITESMLMQDAEGAIAIMLRLKEIGISFSLDDFGTGYSSLSHLKRFPIETLKIDQSFVRDIPGDKNDAAIAATIVAMAHALGISVTAEGVETSEQFAFLRTQKCTTMQGYYFSRPLPAAEFARLLREERKLSNV
ncbi:response regulator receiver protein [Sulfuricella sp. T08]|uniref:EAL domain-containing protein n=1 Tax=Sulfuricella sp. T08 TaxID=1632857 RepID=UPI000617A070|nr:EAL domain-containing protein [Sulfuricella sp. T08]GAO35646.1 response regulator receiver protein [Sulfuricella sp. T08]